MMREKCEFCKHWGALTWKCVHPLGHKDNETAYPDDSCEYFEKGADDEVS
jgi:hypothetical protein